MIATMRSRGEKMARLLSTLEALQPRPTAIHMHWRPQARQR